ncbi:hypothetical protein P3K37_11615 [Staphylococcus pseudintermedius]|uniref:type II toxin-antitoxin system HicB family antitoxin n=3 Tax=Staphylococcus pseudintermedius TaxID=283734 RepID=UPI00385717F0
MKDVNYYLILPYTLKIEQDTDYDGSEYFIAKYEELDGLVGTGDSEIKAVNDLLTIKKDWFEANLNVGTPIPEPMTKKIEEQTRLTLRLPSHIDKQLNQYMQRENVSKNTAIIVLLQSGLYHNFHEEIENKVSHRLN